MVHDGSSQKRTVIPARLPSGEALLCGISDLFLLVRAGGQGQGRTADLPLFRNSIELQGQNVKGLAALLTRVSADQQPSRPL
jgi:hypothetical protein